MPNDNGNQPPNIHLHGCVVFFGNLNRGAEDGDPLSSILNTVSMAVTQSYIRSDAQPAARLDRGKDRQPIDTQQRSSASPASRERSKPAVANDGTCPICGVEISPSALGCRSHWRQVKQAKGQAGKIAELARAYDEEQEDD